MIIKSYDIKNKLNNKINYYLFYGPNTGLVEDVISYALKNNFSKNIVSIYDENEILSKQSEFTESVFNKSLFDNDKLIIINRCSDKISEIISKIIYRNPENIKIIIRSVSLEKKSKLRTFFEKHKDAISTAFYEENHQSLLDFAQNFLKERKIKISFEALGLVIERSKGNRLNLKNELEKIASFSKKDKLINLGQVLKLTSLSENFDFSELVNNFLLKNKRIVIKTLNENNFNDEDNIKIIRLTLYNLKRLKSLVTILKNNNYLDIVLNSYKPLIFWKEKEIIKRQLKNLTLENIKYLIFKLNSLELFVKKNPLASKNLINNFFLEK